MSLYERLQRETAPAREKFLATPLLSQALHQGVERELYLAYLGQAYHHVRHTCPLLATAAGRCGPGDDRLRDALFAYIEEEKGHEVWILDDIRAVGSERLAESVRSEAGDPAVRALVGYMYHAIERISPYAMLGMVFVLEGTSTALAEQAALAIARGLAAPPEQGFRYLRSHGALDQDHVAFFRTLADSIHRPEQQGVIVDTAGMVYRLWGAMFADIVEAWQEHRHAA